MDILVAKHAGFCSGVRRALQVAQQAIQGDNRPLFSTGPLVHNRDVVEGLAAQGLVPVDDLREVERGCLIIRSHGVGPGVYEEAAKRGIALLDATCPVVRRVRNLACELKSKGYEVVIVGNKEHPEVKAAVEWCGGAWVVRSPAEAEVLPWLGKIGVVAQTTMSPGTFESVVEVLKSKGEELAVHNTICGATLKRQRAAYELASQVDVMVVVGSKESANTRELVEVCRRAGTRTYHIERARELCPRWFSKEARVGVTAGASTPGWIIEEVVQKMVELAKENQSDSFAVEENRCEDSPGIGGEGAARAAQDDERTPQEVEGKEESGQKVEGEEESGREVEGKEEDGQEREANVAQGEEDKPAEESPAMALSKPVRGLRRGSIVQGTVVQVGPAEVLVDIGGKSEGVIPLAELSFRPVLTPSDIVSVGDVIEAVVFRVEDEEGRPVLSKKRADRRRAWERLEEAYREGKVISAPVTEVVKGGLLVDVGINGFVPASLVERSYVENLNSYVGRTLRVKVIELDRSRNKVILSQKVVLEEEFERKKQETWASLEDGQVRKGIVRRITGFGAFVDLGGVDGLLHVSEMSWGRVKDPRALLKEGQEVEVKVLKVDRSEGKVSLGMKQLQPNPWDTAAERYPVGSIVQGKVLRIAPFGVFVEVEPGIEGLVHISQLANRRVARPEDVVKVGDVIPVKVLSVDGKSQRMSLSLREARKAEAREAREPVVTETSETGIKLGDLFGDLFEGKRS